MPIKHKFECLIPDSPEAAAAGRILPSHFNDDHTDPDIADVTGLQDALDEKQPVVINETRANILSQTPANGTEAVSTDTNQYYIYRDGWYEFSSIQTPRSGAYDIGYEQASNLAGYGDDYITDKRISNCIIGENAREELGGIRVTYADSLERNIAQYYLDGEWKTALTGVNIQTDDTENPIDIEFTDFTPWVLSLITGNSDVLDPNGVPIVQNMKVDMGVYSSPLLIDGGSF